MILFNIVAALALTVLSAILSIASLFAGTLEVLNGFFEIGNPMMAPVYFIAVGVFAYVSFKASEYIESIKIPDID